MMTKEERERWFKTHNYQVLDSLPDGWKRDVGALTAPNGYYWAYKIGGDIFKGTNEKALIKEYSPDDTE